MKILNVSKALAMLLLLPAASQAGKIYLGVAPGALTAPEPAGVQTRYKIDNTNWDAMLGNGVQPIVPGSFLQSNLGNNSQLVGQTFTYAVTNIIGQGVIFTLDRAATPALDMSLAWGTFGSGVVPSATSAASIGTLGGGIAPQTVPYNALHIFAQASRLGDEVSFSNASFQVTDPSIEIIGSIPVSGGATFAGGSPFDSYIAYVQDDLSAGDLSQVAWSFKADVTINRSSTSVTEAAKFELTGKTAGFTPSSGELAAVPETETWVMGFLAVGVVMFLTRRRAGARA